MAINGFKRQGEYLCRVIREVLSEKVTCELRARSLMDLNMACGRVRGQSDKLSLP